MSILSNNIRKNILKEKLEGNTQEGQISVKKKALLEGQALILNKDLNQVNLQTVKIHFLESYLLK